MGQFESGFSVGRVVASLASRIRQSFDHYCARDKFAIQQMVNSLLWLVFIIIVIVLTRVIKKINSLYIQD